MESLLLVAGEASYDRREDHIMECNYDGASVLQRAVQGNNENVRIIYFNGKL